MNKWPLQRECNEFYGNPRGMNPSHASVRWEQENLVDFFPPFQMTYEGKNITKFKIHKKCHDALMDAFRSMLRAANEDQEKLKFWGVTKFGGSYVYRLMRGGNSLSMHAYGCAIDLDPENNWFHYKNPRFKNFPEVLKAFDEVGAVWGGDWNGNGDTLDERTCDGMHWQFARLR